MHTSWTKVLVAASLVGCAFPASAIPITFDINGTIFSRESFDFSTGQGAMDYSLSGQTFAAHFFVDTDALRVTERINDVLDDVLVIRDAGATSGVQASLSIGGAAVDVTPYPFDASNVQFIDSHGLIPCDDFSCSVISLDSWLVGVRSGTSSPAGGATVRSSFYFSFQEPFDSTVPGSGTTWLDFTQSMNIDLLATLPLGNFPSSWSSLNLRQETESTRTTTNFNVTSFSRTVHSVPEPGSLGLLAAGLFGMFVATRRRQAARN